jgi:hypothetical protein
MPTPTDHNPPRRRRLAMALAVVAVALALEGLAAAHVYPIFRARDRVVEAAQPTVSRDRTMQSGALLRVRFVQETF